MLGSLHWPYMVPALRATIQSGRHGETKIYVFMITMLAKEMLKVHDRESNLVGGVRKSFLKL